LFSTRTEQDISKLLKNGKEDFVMHVKAYNTYGEDVPITSLDKKMIIMRMQVMHITSPYDESDLGSILFAETFFSIDKDTYINISRNVPNL
jgi:hypothetical protein